jgi:hypothetical protein
MPTPIQRLATDTAPLDVLVGGLRGSHLLHLAWIAQASDTGPKNLRARKIKTDLRRLGIGPYRSVVLKERNRPASPVINFTAN